MSTRAGLAKASGRRWDRQAATERINIAEALLSRARAELSFCIVRAPLSGVVLSRTIDVGDILFPQSAAEKAAFEIANTEALEIKAEVEELDMHWVAEGMPVTFSTPGGTLELGKGRILRVSPRAQRRTIGADDARLRADGMVRVVWCEIASTTSTKRRLLVGQRLEIAFSRSSSDRQGEIGDLPEDPSGTTTTLPPARLRH